MTVIVAILVVAIGMYFWISRKDKNSKGSGNGGGLKDTNNNNPKSEQNY